MTFKGKVKIENEEKKKLKVEHKIYLTLLATTFGLTSITYANIFPNYEIKQAQVYKGTTLYKVVAKNVNSLDKIEEVSTDIINRHLIGSKHDEENVTTKVFIYSDKGLNIADQIASVELLEENEFANITTKEQIEIEKKRKEERKQLLENFDLTKINELKKTTKTLKISSKLNGKYYQYKIPFNENNKFQLDLFSKGIKAEDYFPIEDEEIEKN